MASESTASFLNWLNQQNAEIAAREAEKEPPSGVGLDPIREQREDERRAKYGPMRARREGKGRGPSVSD